MRWSESAGGDFENRGAADVKVREHRKRKNHRQTAASVALSGGSYISTASSTGKVSRLMAVPTTTAPATSSTGPP